MGEPDITDRISDCLVFTRSRKMDGLTAAFQDARDEIVALRAMRVASFGLGTISTMMFKVRAEALEEAAQLCFRANPQSNPNAMGHAIRALKDRRDG